MSRDDWLDYHFGQYTIYAASYLDVALLLVADVYLLEISPHACKYAKIVGHERIRGSMCARSLGTLRRIIRKHVDRRHRLVHRGERADLAELEGSDLIQNLRATTLLEHLDPTFALPFPLRIGWRHAIRSVRPTLENDCRRMGKAMELLFDRITPAYERITAKLDVISKRA